MRDGHPKLNADQDQTVNGKVKYVTDDERSNFRINLRNYFKGIRIRLW